MSPQRRRQLQNREMGYCMISVSHGPAEPGKSHCTACLEKRQPGRTAWAEVDWSQDNAVIAASLGVTWESVWDHRKAVGIQCGHPQQPRRKTRWTTVDWTKKDSEIGRQLQVSSVAVRYQRKKLQAAQAQG
jgi:hypothetical protein